MSQIAKVLEKYVSAYPQQWLMLHPVFCEDSAPVPKLMYRMDATAIVITGAEIVTCLGTSREETWRAVGRGECGMRTLTALESPMPEGAIGGQALDLPADYHPELPREVRYLKWTIEAALREAGALDSLPYPADRCGFMLGTTLHGMRQAGHVFANRRFALLHGFLAGNTIEEAVAGLCPPGFPPPLARRVLQVWEALRWRRRCCKAANLIC